MTSQALAGASAASPPQRPSGWNEMKPVWRQRMLLLMSNKWGWISEVLICSLWKSPLLGVFDLGPPWTILEMFLGLIWLCGVGLIVHSSTTQRMRKGSLSALSIVRTEAWLTTRKRRWGLAQQSPLRLRVAFHCFLYPWPFYGNIVTGADECLSILSSAGLLITDFLVFFVCIYFNFTFICEGSSYGV